MCLLVGHVLYYQFLRRCACVIDHHKHTKQLNHTHTITGRKVLPVLLCHSRLQVQQLHASCSHLLRGLAPLQHPSARHTTSLVSTLPDGRPLVDSHPGFEPGRVVVCCGLVGSEPYGPGSTSSSFQLSPILAKMASDVIKSGGGSRSSSSSDGRDSSSESSSSSSGNGGDDSVLAAVSLQREGLAVSSSVGSSGSSSTGGLLGGAVDTWEGLGQLQQRPAVCALQLEEQQDLARDAEQDLIGSRQ